MRSKTLNQKILLKDGRILNRFETLKDSVIQQSKAEELIDYILSEWGKLISCQKHHLLIPDSNFIENAIRPFVLGRTNGLFLNSARGAEFSTILYSLVEFAKAKKLEL